MKNLINNNFIYYFNKWIMPFLGTIFTLCTFIIFWNGTYFFFFHANSHYILRKLLKNKGEDIKSRGYKIFLWDKDKTVSIHKEGEGCIVSSFWSGIWDKKLNHFCYFLLKE